MPECNLRGIYFLPKIQVYPLKKEKKPYFNLPEKEREDMKPEIKLIQVIPEYQTDFKL